MREAPKLFFNPNIWHKKKSEQNKIVAKDVEGLMCINEYGEYAVLIDNKLYDLTDESYDTKNRKIVYAKFLDKYNHRIKIIRDYNRIRLDSRFYVPFTAGLRVKGHIVIRNFITYFNLKRVYQFYSDYENVNRDNFIKYNERIKHKEIILSNDEIKIFR